MTTTTRESGSSRFSEITEECERCARETVHIVAIEMRTENPDSPFSREPYRIAECNVCGATEEVRLNNA